MRRGLPGSALVALAMCGAAASPGEAAASETTPATIVLENETLRLELARGNGALTRLTALPSGWRILDRPHLGLSFRMLVPLEGRRDNPVLGEKQPTSAVEVSPDRRRATFVWDRLVSEHGGPHDIKATLTVTLTARQAVFAMTIDNRSGHVVEDVYCPYLGDVQHPPGEETFTTFSYGYATSQEWSLWPTYSYVTGYWGVDHPTQVTPGAPTAPFILLRGARQGLYAGVAAPSTELVAWHSELRPGYETPIYHHVPQAATIAGQDVATRFAAVHVPLLPSGETRALTPVALEAFRGDWHAGVDIYKAWRDGWMKRAQPPQWARDVHAWQQIHLNSPEDELRTSYRDLVRIGEDCARHGVKAIQVTGWNDGGQDQNNPSHDTDPRLGTWQDLRDAIAAVQALGVKVILFAKFTWADRATDRFRNDLVRLAIKDPYGDYYVHGGYRYQTAAQLLDINTKRLVPMCFLSEDYKNVAEREFEKTVRLGADGILFDECQHHGPALLCFDPAHGHRRGAPVYADDRRLIQRFARRAEATRPDFLFAGEAIYDWEFEAYPLSYARSESKAHVPLQRYLEPDAPLMTAVTGFNDRHMLNQCLLYRYIASYEPRNFKGRLDEFPQTMDYGRKMDALRTELREYVWDGEFRDTTGAQVTAQGQPHHPYSVFVSRKDGKAAVVVANYDDHEAVTVEVKLDDGTRPARYRLVDAPDWRPAAGGVVLPPASAAVVVQ